MGNEIKISGSNYEVNSSPDKLAEFASNLLGNDEFRSAFDKDPSGKMHEYGIKVSNISAETLVRRAAALREQSSEYGEPANIVPAVVVAVGVRAGVQVGVRAGVQVGVGVIVGLTAEEEKKK